MTDTRSRPAAGRPRDPDADARILHATFVELVRVGYGGLTIEAIAAAAGVAKTTIYRRYPSKRELAIAALGREAPFPAVPDDIPTRDALDRFVRLVIVGLVESGAIRILASLLVEDEREPGVLDAFRARIVGPRREVVVEMLRRGVERGELRPGIDPLLVTEMVAGAVFGHHIVLGQATTDAWVDALVEHVWAAIAAT